MASHDADTMVLRIRSLRGEEMIVVVDAELAPVIQMMLSSHPVLEQKYLAKENRFVWVPTGERVKLMNDVALHDIDEKIVDLEEFKQRELGTYKEPERQHPLQQLFSGMVVAKEDEEPPKRNLN